MDEKSEKCDFLWQRQFFCQCVSHLSGTATRLLVRRLRLTVCTSAVMNIYGGINGGVEITTLLSAQTREC